MPGSPSVTVLLPVFNGREYLRPAVVSVLTQEKVTLELLVIDDGSNDDSLAVLESIQDRRMRTCRQANRGLAATLNRGIELASSKYIARQDQDDLVLPGRLARQVGYLEDNPDCAMVGTWSHILVGNEVTTRGHHYPISHEALCLELLFDNPFVHSSVMFRTAVVSELGGYCEDRSRQPPEDYELWSRMARKYRLANIPAVLTGYRDVPGSMSRSGKSPFLGNLIRISGENLAAALSSRATSDDCLALAAMYHEQAGGAKGKRISLRKALKLHRQAAEVLGGNMTQWSEEFARTFHRQRARIISRVFLKYLPDKLLRRIWRFRESRFGF